MTAPAALALVVLVVGFASATAAVARSDARLGLRLVHPAVGWVTLTAVFFGIGSVVLALDGRPASVAWTGAALIAFGAGVAASDTIARGRHDRPEPVRRPAPSVRLPVVAALGLAGLAAVVPTLLASGLPFVTTDITGARAELAGLPVQVLRVMLPAAAAVALLAALAGRTNPRTAAAAVVVIGAIAAFEFLLASRYLLAELAALLVIAVLLAGRRVPLRAAAALGAAGIVLFLGVQLGRAWDEARGRELAFLAERTVSRVALVQPRTIDALMRVIPAEQPHFGGLTWARRLTPLVGREDVPNLGYWIYPEVVEGRQDVAGYAAPGWLGEAWANLGWSGLALFVLLGAAVERLAALIAARRLAFGGRLPDADVVAAGLAVLFVARTHALGVNGLIVVLVLVAAWRLLAARPAGLGGDVRRTLAWRV